MSKLGWNKTPNISINTIFLPSIRSSQLLNAHSSSKPLKYIRAKSSTTKKINLHNSSKNTITTLPSWKECLFISSPNAGFSNGNNLSLLMLKYQAKTLAPLPILKSSTIFTTDFLTKENINTTRTIIYLSLPSTKSFQNSAGSFFMKGMAVFLLSDTTFLTVTNLPKSWLKFTSGGLP